MPWKRLKAQTGNSMQSDIELDVLMAEKVMGWRRGDYCWIGSGGVPIYQIRQNWTPNGSPVMPAWRPSIDITTAMKVLEKVGERRVKMEWNSDVNEWCVTLGSAPALYAHAEKLPSAICQAVRAAKCTEQ